MPFKAVPIVNILATVISLGLLGTQSDTSIVELNKQSVEWYREIII